MSEYSAESQDWVAKSLLFAEWRAQMAAGYLTAEGLRAVRARLDGNEFLPGADLDLMRLDVDTAIAADLGIDVGLMPGRAPTPDDASELDG